jgi:RHS repeat-associated protein
MLQKIVHLLTAFVLLANASLPARIVHADPIPGTPTPTPEMSLLTPTPSETPSAPAPADLAPTADTPQETPAPDGTAQAAPAPGTSLQLYTDPTVVEGSQPFQLEWTASLAKDTPPDDLQIEVTLPRAVTPVNLDAQTGVILLPLTSSGSLEMQIADGAAPPLTASARLLSKGQPLAETKLELRWAKITPVSAAGGDASSPDGRVRVHFPQGALAQDAAVRVGPSTTPGLYALINEPVEITAAGVSDKASLEKFDPPLGIEIGYDPNDPRIAGNENGLQLVYWDTDSLSWRVSDSQVDVEGHVVRGQTSHLSDWSLDVTKWQSAKLPNLADFQVSSFTGAATYSLPIQVPDGPGGLKPSLSLSYNSQVVDQANALTQASWVGMGWSLDTGYIERNMQGTDDYLDDDTFNLVLNGIGGLLLKDTNGVWHTSNEQFIKINVSGNVWSKYDETTSWEVWDKVGNYYQFASRLKYPSCVPNDVKFPAHHWYLTKMRNPAGKELIFTYGVEAKRITGYCNLNPYADYAAYPQYIYYPGDYSYGGYNVGKYRIYFYTTNDRRDWYHDWNYASQTRVQFMKSRLREIQIQYSPSGAFNDVQVVHKYAFTYSRDMTDNPNPIWPGYDWPVNDGQAKDKTLTLRKIEEYFCAPGASSCTTLNLAPDATLFTYGDNMHLTEAANNYGGKVTFTYQAWAGDVGDALTQDQPDFRRILTHVDVTSPTYNYFMAIPDYLFHPGGYYQVHFRGKDNIEYDGNTLLFRMKDGVDAEFANEGPYYVNRDNFNAYITKPFHLTQPPAPNTRTFLARAEANRGNSLIGFECNSGNHGCRDVDFMARWVTTYYRVTAKTVTAASQGIAAQSITTSYRYDEAAMNDRFHSAVVKSAYDAYTCCGVGINYGLFTQASAEFRGHASSEVIEPNGKITTTYYHQDDYQRGQPQMTIVHTSSFHDDFDTISTANWTGANVNVSAAQAYINGDYALSYTGANSNTYLWRNSGYALPGGTAFMFQFRVSGSGTSALYYVDNGQAGANYRRVGIYAQPNGALFANYYEGITNGWNAQLLSAAEFKRDTWYAAVLTTATTGGKYGVWVWERDSNDTTAAKASFNAANLKSYEYLPGSGASPVWNGSSWCFVTYADGGSIALDGYTEGKLFAIQASGYADPASLSDTTSVTMPTAQTVPIVTGGNYSGLSIYWTRQTAQIGMTFAGSNWLGTKTEMVHDSTYQGGTQYGNVTDVIESNESGGIWARYRATRSRFYPFRDATHNLAGLPAVNNLFACPNGTCAYASADLVSSKIFIYDNSTSLTYSTPPSQGILTRVRSMTRWNGPSSGNNQMYQDQVFAYDSWGNRTGVTTWTGEGTYTAAAASGAQTTTTSYDSPTHTYPVAVQDALPGTHPPVSTSYDYLSGLPTAMTDLNSSTTTLVYDNFWRLWKVVRPGDSVNAPTNTVSYSYDSANKLFWTEAQQRIDSTTTLVVRKFYNGLGRLVQVQTAGAVVNGAAKDIVVDYAYDDNGLWSKVSMPFKVTSGSAGYEYSAASAPYWTQTFLDELGRVVEARGPWQTSTTSQRASYAIANGQMVTTATDPKGNVTTSSADAFGRTAQVAPPAGPGTGYTYDAGDHMISVAYGSATTYLAYDMGGRKTGLTDPDMGTWWYQYDALGNLVSQTDARGCATWLTYDALNRPTGKSYSGTNCTTPSVTYTYDAGTNGKGQRTGMTDGSGSTAWTYTNRGLMAAESKTISGGGTYLTQYSYNSANLITSMTYPDNEVLNYTYLPQGSISQMKDAGTYVYAAMTYDAAGRVVTRSLDNGAKTQTTNYFTWDNQAGKLESILSTGLESLTYSYDLNGNVATITDGLNASQKQCFTYDALNRLTLGTTYADAGQGCTTALGAGNYNTVFGYDAATGNLTSKAGSTLAYNDAAHKHAATSYNTSYYAYDADGNMISYDWNGSTYSLGYDAANHLTSVIKTGATYNFSYDGNDFRTKASSPTATTYFVGNTYEVTGSTITKYYYAGSDRIAMKQGTELYFFFTDHLGSTVNVYQKSTSTSNLMRYYNWGTERGTSTLTMPSRYTFTGQYSYTPDFGLLYYNARWYSPDTGRFITPDSIIPQPYDPPSYDRYMYVRNSPPNFNDPSGHDVGCGGRDSTDCKNIPTKYPNYDKHESAREAAGLVVNWFFELGPDVYIYDKSNSLTQDVMASQGMAEFREAWKLNNYEIPFNYNQTIDDRDHGVSPESIKTFFNDHFVNNLLSQFGFGSDYAEGNVDPIEGTIGSLDRIDAVEYDKDNVAIVVHNAMGWASGTRIPGTNFSILNNTLRSDPGPGGTTWHVFYWVEPKP